MTGAQVFAQRNYVVVAFEKIEVFCKPEIIDVQSLGVTRLTARPLGDAVIAEDAHAPAMAPGGEPGNSHAIQQRKQNLLHRGKLQIEQMNQLSVKGNNRPAKVLLLKFDPNY